MIGRYGWKGLLGAAIGTLSLGMTAAPGGAYLYWVRPDFSGPVVRGDEPGIVVPLTNAKAAEIDANLVWSLRAALHVAALQCQFSAPLMTVKNYNTMLRQHDAEFDSAYKTLNSYFRRTVKKNSARAFDDHNTRIYNGFSTVHAQISFCETAGKIGRLALTQQRGSLHDLAAAHMREIRNSLIPTGDSLFAFRPTLPAVTSFPLEDACWDRRGNLKKKCQPAT